MRLAVSDIDLIVSAGVKPGGAPAKLVMDWVLEGQMQVATNPWVIGEYRQVIQRAKFRRYGFPPLAGVSDRGESAPTLPDPAA
jgi:uncharacterized protein